MLDKLVASGAPGALAQFRDDSGTWAGASGVAERGSERPVDPDGWFRIGSITKTFTATVVLQLVGEGRLDAKDTVERWLPGLVPGGGGITLLHLLNHTSGLYEYTSMPDTGWSPARSFQTMEPARDRGVRQPRMTPRSSRGGSWAYSQHRLHPARHGYREGTGSSYDERDRSAHPAARLSLEPHSDVRRLPRCCQSLTLTAISRSTASASTSPR